LSRARNDFITRDLKAAVPRCAVSEAHQPAPGATYALQPKADHVESKRFPVAAVMVTGGDSGIGRTVAGGPDLLVAYLS
jgi:hypothetical protein